MRNFTNFSQKILLNRFLSCSALLSGKSFSVNFFSRWLYYIKIFSETLSFLFPIKIKKRLFCANSLIHSEFHKWLTVRSIFLVVSISLSLLAVKCKMEPVDELKENFKNPPDTSRPGVYWYFMDGNLSREGMTADLESMRDAGIGSVLFLEVNVGIPRGRVDFLSDEWQELYKHAVNEAERLGIEVILGSGPGWAGSGGPWVKPEQSMRHLVASETRLKGPVKFNGDLPRPSPKKPYFGEGALTPSLKEKWNTYYEDAFVLAFPTPKNEKNIRDIDEKALYYRAPYTSREGVKPFLPVPAYYDEVPGAAIDIDKILDITDNLKSDGRLLWDVPEGDWTIMRFGLRNNGAVTRPAPAPGLGFEADKFDTTAFNAHFDEYIVKLIKKTGGNEGRETSGWTMIHIDSWEMGAQNWSDNFVEEFKQRRGYDPQKFFPAYLGKIVGSLEVSERFLWDIRQTAMELVIENHAGHFKELGRRYGFTLSIEPYDMNPASDLDLGAVADIPMCEFWTKGLGFNSSFSCIEATSIAHVYGRPVVAAEAFTADSREAWKMYPGNVKNQGDWAFCMGINKFMYHTFAHKPLGENYRPGMTMGPYGVHWDRGQTWWPLASEYHRYISRCQHMLRQGQATADILYLTPEGAPHVFRPPMSALEGDDVLPDKRGYNFDGCSPHALIEKAGVEDNRIVFPGGASYRVLVMPDFETMTPMLLEKIESLIMKGAIVVGAPPHKSPGLTDYPQCDDEVKNLAMKIWGTVKIPEEETEIKYGRGKVYWGGNYSKTDNDELYPNYGTIANLLGKMGINEDFQSLTGSIRYNHRITEDKDIYFVSNRSDSIVDDICTFRTARGIPELWDPVTGETRLLPEYTFKNGQISIPLRFDRSQSFFIVFDRKENKVKAKGLQKSNFLEVRQEAVIGGSWNVSFEPRWGGPDNIIFDKLIDWSVHPNQEVRYYSGSATYYKNFDLPDNIIQDDQSEIYLDLGKVKNIARLALNGNDLGIVWTSPWRVIITDVVKRKNNNLEIQVVNLWPNRLIGDEKLPDDGIKNREWPEWLLKNQPRESGRFTFTTWDFYDEDSSLLSSGLIGPVTIVKTSN